MLGLYGGADAGFRSRHREDADGPEERPARPCEIIVYPDTPHAFMADYRPSYRKEAAEGRLETAAGMVQEVWGFMIISKCD